MARFGFSYDWRTAPIAFGLGLVPPLTYVDVDDHRLQVRIGPWFVLEAPRSVLGSADVARGDLGLAPQVTAFRADGWERLQFRTSKGPLARIRFAERQHGKLLLGLPRLRPELVLLNVGPKVPVDELALSVSDPSGLVSSLA